MKVWLAVAALFVGAEARAQNYSFPTSSADYGTFYPTAYKDHGGRDWACGTIRYTNHRGSDFGVGGFAGMDAGRDVVAAAAGTVTAVHDGEFDRCTSGACGGGGGFGNYVYVRHANGRTTIYAHLKKWSVLPSVGQTVQCGQKLGEAGSAGNSTGPHLHFQVNSSSNVAEDPFDGPCSGPPSYWVSQGSHGGRPAISCPSAAQCSQVAALACGQAIQSANNAGGSQQGINSYGCSPFQNTSREISYSFRTGANEQVVLDLTGLSADLDLFVSSSTTCNGANCVTGSWNGNTNNERVVFNAMANHTYTVTVDGYGSAISGFRLAASCTGGVPAWRAEFQGLSGFPSNNGVWTLNAGDVVSGTMRLKNTGSGTWSGGVVKLGTTNPRDRTSPLRASSWPGGNRAAVVTSSVAPGQTVDVPVSFKAPSSPGRTVETFGLVAEGVTWFANAGGPSDNMLTIDVTVRDPNDCGGYVRPTWYRDADNDGYGNAAVTTLSCTPVSGYVANRDDCDDTDRQRAPNLPEVCDHKDNDCDTVVDDGVGDLWYLDADSDGFGWAASQVRACEAPDRHVSNRDDCDDTLAEVRPGADEVCNDRDDDCDSVADDSAIDAPTWFKDADLDDFGLAWITEVRCRPRDEGWTAPYVGDCDDSNPNINPGALDVPYDGIDQDCTQLDLCDVDEDGIAAPYSDCGGTDCADGDPLVSPSAVETANGADDDCDGVVDDDTTAYDDDDDGFSEDAGDCDDQDASRNPGAREICTGQDTDCDGVVDNDTECADDDGDGAAEHDGDCDDTRADVGLHRAEVLGNGVDDDCDGTVDNGAFDGDHDGVAVSGGDCDDARADVSPRAPEVKDGVDNDCDASTDEGTDVVDDDGDGFTEVEGDCDDTDRVVHPGAPEPRNGRDDDCDGRTDDGGDTYDDDGDGLSEVEGDCDDDRADVNPGAAELANDVDDDCDGVVDDGVDDADGDGLSAAAGDCDDHNGWVYRGQEEICDHLDNDCDGVVDPGCPTDGAPVSTARSCATGPGSLGWGALAAVASVFARRRRQRPSAAATSVTR